MSVVFIYILTTGKLLYLTLYYTVLHLQVSQYCQ